MKFDVVRLKFVKLSLLISMYKEKLYPKMEKLEVQISRCRRQGLTVMPWCKESDKEERVSVPELNPQIAGSLYARYLQSQNFLNGVFMIKLILSYLPVHLISPTLNSLNIFPTLSVGNTLAACHVRLAPTARQLRSNSHLYFNSQSLAMAGESGEDGGGKYQMYR